MSEPLRVAVAAEGPTDFTVLEAILEAILTVEFRLDPLQPERSAAFGPSGRTGVGWAACTAGCAKRARRAVGLCQVHRCSIVTMC